MVSVITKHALRNDFIPSVSKVFFRNNNDREFDTNINKPQCDSCNFRQLVFFVLVFRVILLCTAPYCINGTVALLI